MGLLFGWRRSTAEGGLGLEISIGPGRLFLEAALGLFPLINDTAGNAVSLSLTSSLGYRVIFNVW